FNFETARKETGLERILGKWGVAVGANVIKDPDNTLSGNDVIINQFAKHPVVLPLLGQSRLHLILPRTISKAKAASQNVDAPRVDEIAMTGPRSVLSDGHKEQPYPVAVAVEKGAIKGVLTERGTTRMIVVGDSIFLANRQLDSAANRDFAEFAVNWLLDRTQLVQGL